MAKSCRAALLAGLLSGSNAAGTEIRHPTPSAACAAHDLNWLILIEDHGRADEMAADDIARAMMDVVEARTACRAGEVDRALHLYEAIHLHRPRIGPAYWVVTQ